MSELTEMLWNSDEASALTNKAARHIKDIEENNAKLEADNKELKVRVAELLSLSSRAEKEIHKCDKIYSEAIDRSKELKARVAELEAVMWKDISKTGGNLRLEEVLNK